MAALCAEAAACGSFFTRFLPVTRTTPANSELQLEQLHLVVFLGSALETPAVAEKGSLPTSVPVRYSLTSYASVCVSCSMSGLHGHAAKPKAQLLGSQWPGWGGFHEGTRPTRVMMELEKTQQVLRRHQQDGSSKMLQLSPPLDPRSNAPVLYLCAAPGSHPLQTTSLSAFPIPGKHPFPCALASNVSSARNTPWVSLGFRCSRSWLPHRGLFLCVTQHLRRQPALRAQKPHVLMLASFAVPS